MLRKLVAGRARSCCEYCLSQEQISSQPFALEHIIPRDLGGESTLENLAYSCQGCNNHKYNKTVAADPGSGELVPIYNPRIHIWLDHFEWRDDFTQVEGTTAIGRATVVALHLNRPGLVNQRRLLRQVGQHPLPD